MQAHPTYYVLIDHEYIVGASTNLETVKKLLEEYVSSHVLMYKSKPGIREKVSVQYSDDNSKCVIKTHDFFSIFEWGWCVVHELRIETVPDVATIKFV